MADKKVTALTEETLPTSDELVYIIKNPSTTPLSRKASILNIIQYTWSLVTHGLNGKTTPINADEIGIVDTADSNLFKKLTFTNLKAFLKTYFDTLYNNYTIATDPIWDAAGDTVYGTGADTASRLAKGTAGQVYTMNAGATAPAWASVVTNRQGGSATEWNTRGTTNYVPTNTKIQVGSTILSTVNDVGSVTITFPVAFAYKPVCFVTCATGGGPRDSCGTSGITASQFVINYYADGSGTMDLTIHWMAIGAV